VIYLQTKLQSPAITCLMAQSHGVFDVVYLSGVGVVVCRRAGEQL